MGKNITVERNTICTLSPTGYGEIVLYHEPFKVTVERGDEDERAHLRKFFRDEDGCWQARTTIDLIKQDLMLRKCGKRATKKIILYAMANRWEQFITLTFAPEMVNRYDEIECKEKWREFQRYCKRMFPDCKLIAVWEYHKKKDEFGARALHFHLLASGLNFPTISYLNEDGSQKYSKSGAPLYILTPKAWPFGLSTVAYLPKDGSDNARVVNYLTKYVSKYRARSGDDIKMCEEAGNYNAQRYFHTRNLDICASSVMEEVMNKKEVYEFAKVNGFELHKVNDRFTVFRRYPNSVPKELEIDIPEDNEPLLVIQTEDDFVPEPVPKVAAQYVSDTKKVYKLFDREGDGRKELLSDRVQVDIDNYFM